MRCILWKKTQAVAAKSAATGAFAPALRTTGGMERATLRAGRASGISESLHSTNLFLVRLKALAR